MKRVMDKIGREDEDITNVETRIYDSSVCVFVQSGAPYLLHSIMYNQSSLFHFFIRRRHRLCVASLTHSSSLELREELVKSLLISNGIHHTF